MFLSIFIKAQSSLEIGVGIPIQQFEHSGAKKVRTDGLGFAFDLGYLYRWNRFSAALSLQYVSTSDVFQDINPMSSSNYKGQVNLLRINPYIGYQFLVSINRDKSRKIAIEPLLGLTRDMLISAQYTIDGKETPHLVNNFFALSPIFGFRLGYAYSERYSINVKAIFGYKIQSGNYDYYPSIYMIQSDAVIETYFSNLYITLIRQL